MTRYLHYIFSFGIVFLSLLLYTHYFKFILWQETSGPKFLWFFLAFCLFLTIVLFRRIKGHDFNRTVIVGLLMLLLFSETVKLLQTQQPIDTVRISVLMFLATMQYFLLKEIRITERQVLWSFTMFGLISFSLQLYQQMPDTIPLFGIINNDESSIGTVRNDIYKFTIGSYFVSIICLYYWWTELCKKFSLVRCILFCCFLVSMYLYLVRQIMAVSLLTLALSLFLIPDKRARRLMFVFIVFAGVILIALYDLIFAALVENYQNDTWTTDIRFKCIDFVIGQIFDNPIQALIGHGHDIVERQWTRMNYYISDIGFIGECFYYGVAWLVIYFSTVFLYVVKYRNKIPLYIRLYMIGTLMNSIFIFPYRTNEEMFIWICLLYIAHLYVDNKKGVYNKLISEPNLNFC